MDRDPQEGTGRLAAREGDAPALAVGSRPLAEMLRIAMPSIATMTSYTVMQFIDAKMVAHITPASPAYIAAQGNGGVSAWSAIAMMFGMLVVVNTYVSQNLGAGHPERGSPYAWSVLWLSLVWAVLLIPYGIAQPAMFHAFGHPPEMVTMETPYARILVFGGFLTMSSRGLSNFFYGLHRARVVLIGAVVGNLANALMNVVFIFGSNGMPSTGIAPLDALGNGAQSLSRAIGLEGMGVTGAGVGTLLGTSIELAVLMVVFLGPRMNRLYHTRAAWRPDRKAIGDILRIGWPGGVMMVNEIVCWALVFSSLVPMAGTIGAAHSMGVSVDDPAALHAGTIANTGGWIALRYMHVSFMPAVGLSIAVTATVGKYLGMGRPDLARRRAWLGLRLTLTYMGLCGLAFVLFRGAMIRFFAPQTLGAEDVAALVRMGSMFMIAAAVFQLFDALAITLLGALRGAGDTTWSGLVTVALSWGVMVLGGLAMIHLFPHLGHLGPWIAISGYIIALGAAMLWRFLFGPWHRINLIAPGEAGLEADGTPT